jgi:HEAT repeat protein
VPVPTDLLAAAVLAESDPNVAGALRWALARAGDDGMASLVAGVSSNDVAIRRRAVLAIAELPESPGANAALADALGDSDATVRRHAALASGNRGATAAVPTLVRMVVDGTNDVEASEVLGTLALDPDHAAQIMNALANEVAHTTDSAVRIRLAQALAEMPATIAQNTLQQLTRDEDRSVALIATAFLRMLEER